MDERTPSGKDNGIANPSVEEGTRPEKSKERERLQRDLYKAFTTLEGYFDGGMTRRLPGDLENANICLLTKDGDGEFAAKIGWGDFALESDKGGPAQLSKIYGPVFILGQFGAYMLHDKNANDWLKNPREYLFRNARFIIDGNNIYIPSELKRTIQMAARPDTLPKIQFVEFSDHEFQKKFGVVEAEEYLRQMYDGLIKDKIGVEIFEKLVDKISGPDGGGAYFKLRRVRERWAHLVANLSDKSFSLNLWKDEAAWRAELQRDDFLNRIRRLISERGIDVYRDSDKFRQARDDAFGEFDPDVAEDLKLAQALDKLIDLEIYHRENILNFCSRWDREKKEFRRRDSNSQPQDQPLRLTKAL